MTAQDQNNRWILRASLALAYAFAGVAHLRTPEFFMAITPDWVPMPREVIIATGVCEMAGAAALMTGRLRYAAGVMLALYALCVYPANVKHAIDDIMVRDGGLGWGYHAPRLAFQPVIIWWALYAGGVVSWPFARRAVTRGSR
jgi:uncharacterized membrane protein